MSNIQVFQAIVLVAPGQTGLSVTITSGATILGTQAVNPGYNSFSVFNLTTGTVVVQVVDTGSPNTVVISGKGPIDVRLTAVLHRSCDRLCTNILKVTDSAPLCNYNFQVVGLSGISLEKRRYSRVSWYFNHARRLYAMQKSVVVSLYVRMYLKSKTMRTITFYFTGKLPFKRLPTD